MMSKSSFSLHGDFAKMCTTLERELDFDGLRVPKMDAKSQRKTYKVDARKHDARMIKK